MEVNLKSICCRLWVIVAQLDHVNHSSDQWSTYFLVALSLKKSRALTTVDWMKPIIRYFSEFEKEVPNWPHKPCFPVA